MVKIKKKNIKKVMYIISSIIVVTGLYFVIAWFTKYPPFSKNNKINKQMSVLKNANICKNEPCGSVLTGVPICINKNDLTKTSLKQSLCHNIPNKPSGDKLIIKCQTC